MILFCSAAMGQKYVEVLQADYLEYNEKIADGVERLVGQVVLQLDESTLTCDSAYIYRNHNFTAFNNVHVSQGDSVHLYGDILNYSHLTKKADLQSDVMLRDNSMTIKTNFMSYNMETDVGSYSNGGTITSIENNNKLTSKYGNYNTKTDVFVFRKDVVLLNPDYEVKSDTLHYNNNKETAFFFGPTTITNEDSKIYCENGWYNTKTEICQFSKNAIIHSDNRSLKGDSIYYNGGEKYGEAFRNVEVRDTLENYFINGNYGYHNQEQDSSYVVGRAVFTQGFDNDSLYLHADTLLSLKDTSKHTYIKAFHKVKFYKSDIQGKSDSLIWLNSDSLLHMFYEPVIWNNESQMTADTITISMANGKVDELYARKNAFLISSKGAGKYDQIKGRTLTGFFKNNELNRLLIKGNGQAVYFPVEEKDNEKTIKGVNKIDCSDIVIYMKDQNIDRIIFLTSPKGAMLPLGQAVKEDEVLEGFIWRGSERPTSPQNIFFD